MASGAIASIVTARGRDDNDRLLRRELRHSDHMDDDGLSPARPTLPRRCVRRRRQYQRSVCSRSARPRLCRIWNPRPHGHAYRHRHCHDQIRLIGMPASTTWRAGTIVHRDGVPWALVATTEYTIWPHADTTYVYSVTAADAAGNRSEPHRRSPSPHRHPRTTAPTRPSNVVATADAPDACPVNGRRVPTARPGSAATSSTAAPPPNRSPGDCSVAACGATLSCRTTLSEGTTYSTPSPPTRRHATQPRARSLSRSTSPHRCRLTSLPDQPATLTLPL